MIGPLRERLVILRNDPPTLIVALTRTSTTATATTLEPHRYVAGDYVLLADATVTGYAGKKKILTVTALTFTFACDGTLATPATATATYVSNGQGGQGLNFWRTVDTVAAQYIPIRTSEVLALAAIQSDVISRFRIRARPDLTAGMRVLWTPTTPTGSPRQTLELTGVLPDERDRAFQIVDVAAVSA